MRRYSNRNRKNSRTSKKHLRKTARKSMKKLFKGGDDKEELDNLNQSLETAEKALTDYRNLNAKFITKYEKRRNYIEKLLEEIETTDNEMEKAKLEKIYEKNSKLKESEQDKYDSYEEEEHELSMNVFRLVKELEKIKSSPQRDALIKHFNRPQWELHIDYRLPSK